MAECIFCKIVTGDIPATVVRESSHVLAFRDVSPQAPSHVLVIPKTHVRNVSDMTQLDPDVISDVFATIRQVSEDEGLSESGFRVVTNTGVDGGQTVDHLHFHILGGRSLQWPPG